MPNYSLSAASDVTLNSELAAGMCLAGEGEILSVEVIPPCPPEDSGVCLDGPLTNYGYVKVTLCSGVEKLLSECGVSLVVTGEKICYSHFEDYEDQVCGVPLNYEDVYVTKNAEGRETLSTVEAIAQQRREGVARVVRPALREKVAEEKA